jgi:hypothetical protein
MTDPLSWREFTGHPKLRMRATTAKPILGPPASVNVVWSATDYVEAS